MKLIYLFFLLMVENLVVNCNVVRNNNNNNNNNIRVNEKRMHSDGEFNNDSEHFVKNPIKSNKINTNEDDPAFWLNQAKNYVSEQINKLPNKNIAKNIIYFLGDGLSIPTLAATRAYIGGEEIPLSFESFPAVGMVKTYCLNYQVPDSACTATAYLTGVKANYNTIGVNGQVPVRDCERILDKSTHTHSIAQWALDAGKQAGIITTTRITDASPAGTYAHISDRDWETDVEMEYDGCDSTIVDDIAKQMIYGDVGKNLRVMLGGGRSAFLDSTIVDDEGRRGERGDGRNLINEWLNNKVAASDVKRYIWNTTDLNNINADETDYLLGLFEYTHLRYHLEVEDSNIGDLEPSLTQMTEKAIDLLNAHSDENGFFLFVEGGRIDLAHHGTYARIALDETAEFSKAITAAMAKVNLDETLIVVTADHSHTVSFNGYPNRNADVLDVAGVSNMDQLPYMTLSYTNGPGFNNHYNTAIGRLDINDRNTKSIRYQFPSTILSGTESHGGDDVAIFAKGPWSHLFTGVYEQSNIPHLIGYAACIGDGPKACT